MSRPEDNAKYNTGRACVACNYEIREGSTAVALVVWREVVLKYDGKAVPMPWIVRGRVCSSCNQKHHSSPSPSMTLSDAAHRLDVRLQDINIVTPVCDTCGMQLHTYATDFDHGVRVWSGPTCVSCKEQVSQKSAIADLIKSVMLATNEQSKNTAAIVEALKPKIATDEPKEKTNPMKDLMSEATSNANDAAWRLARSQMVKLVREPLIATMAGGDEGARKSISTFLSTPIGEAALCALMSAGLSGVTALPGAPRADVVARLSAEFRVHSMAVAGDMVADLLMGPLREVLVNFLSAPAASALAAKPSQLGEGNGNVFEAAPATLAPLKVGP